MLDSITCLVDVRIVDLALRLNRVDADLLQAHISYSVRGLRKRKLLVVIQILRQLCKVWISQLLIARVLPQLPIVVRCARLVLATRVKEVLREVLVCI